MALDRRDQLAPWRHRLNLSQEAAASRLPLLARVLILGKTRLHRRSSLLAPRSLSAQGHLASSYSVRLFLRGGHG